MFHHAEGWVWAGTVILIDRTSCELQIILTTHQYQHDSWQTNILTHLQRDKSCCIELWKAVITLSNIQKQLKISRQTLWRILKAVKKDPVNPDLDWKKGGGRKKLINPETLAIMKKYIQIYFYTFFFLSLYSSK
jgi:hypothetical protein